MKSKTVQIIALTAMIILVFSIKSQAQSFWESAPDGIVHNNGWVGIGVTNPERVFHLRDNLGILRVDRNGNSPGFMAVRFNEDYSQIHSSYFLSAGYANGQRYFTIIDMKNSAVGSNGIERRLVVTQNGAVNIGSNTSVPSGYKLAVEGKVICEELRVKLQSEWPDYVFDDSYTLMPLAEVSDYIQTNKHLPGLPTAGEMEGGVAVGEMNRLLVEKVEELTLYAIEAEKENEALQNDLSSLKAEIEMLKAMINK